MNCRPEGCDLLIPPRGSRSQAKSCFLRILNRILRWRLACSLAAALAAPAAAAASPEFDINLWPDGRVPFRFADTLDKDRWDLNARPLSSEDQETVMWEMFIWETALTNRDPLNPAQKVTYVHFVPCGRDRCASETNYVLIRYNSTKKEGGALKEKNNMCAWYDDEGREHVGRSPKNDLNIDPQEDRVTDLHFATGNDTNTIRHELGHCLGLWHEFNRSDRDYWLDEQPDADGKKEWDDDEILGVRVPDRGPEMPQLGNYDYDSIMHYSSWRYDKSANTCNVQWEDLADNRFDRHGLDSPPSKIFGKCDIFPAGIPPFPASDLVSPRDKSRLLQYYARERQANWGFFESLNRQPSQYDYDGRVDPYLVGHVAAEGTPAVVFQGQDTYDIFVRGSDENMYWKRFRPFEPGGSDWLTLGCCFGSDPAAISMAGQIEVVAIGAVTGRPLKARYANGVWGSWVYVRDDAPTIKKVNGRYLGPAVASRSPGLLDIFVVQSDGLLAVTTRKNGAWSGWQSLVGTYNVTARPAALAQTSTKVKLAINSANTRLYEPLVTFTAGQPPTLSLGNRTAWTASNAAPALTERNDSNNPYRVLIVTPDGRIGHKFAGGAWRDIGGIPLEDTGVSAVATGPYSALMVMNGEGMFGCSRTCLKTSTDPGAFIQPGGVWLRKFF